MFNHAHHFNVEKIEVSAQNADALKDLCQNIAIGALLNSEERSDAPKCHPATRVAVQEEIFGWVTYDNDGTLPKILWLTGPAGSGKTTIMNTVGERLHKSGNLAGTFFFSSFTGSLERSTKGRFITTLVYQLIQHDTFQGIREHILSSIAKNPAILKMHLREQMEVLILRPLRDRQDADSEGSGDSDDPSPPDPQVLLVDGLDECGQTVQSTSEQSERDTSQMSREQDQAEILGVLLDALDDPAFPFRIIIASRPEPAIQHFFSTSAKDQVTEIFLDDKYNPDDDIKLFLTSHFSRIQRRHSHLPLSWPGEDIIATLIRNASGQMIYAATVIRFVETPTRAPEVQLGDILRSGSNKEPSPSNHLGPLDSLYAKILGSSPSPNLAFNWLKAYLYLDIEDGFRTWCLNRLCETYRGEARHLFARMSALVRISDEHNEESARYIFYHKSFQDFLSDKARYSVLLFPTSEEQSRNWLIRHFIDVFRRGRRQSRIDHAWIGRFSEEILKLWYLLIMERESFTEFYDEQLISCDKFWWIAQANLREKAGRAFTMLMFVVCHNQCRPFWPCRASCKRWRTLILRRWKDTSQDSVHISLPGRIPFLLDRFGLKRFPLRSTWFGVTVFHQKPSGPPTQHEAESGSSLWSVVAGEPRRRPAPSRLRRRSISINSRPSVVAEEPRPAPLRPRRRPRSLSSAVSSVATGHSGMFGDNSTLAAPSSSRLSSYEESL